jgi:hypothetical protein
MKSNPLLVALVAVLVVCAVMTAVLSATFTLKLRKLGSMQARLIQINNVNSFLRSLSADSVEYSKKNPAINPLLQTFGVISPEPKPAANPVPAANKPAGK